MVSVFSLWWYNMLFFAEFWWGLCRSFTRSTAVMFCILMLRWEMSDIILEYFFISSTRYVYPLSARIDEMRARQCLIPLRGNEPSISLSVFIRNGPVIRFRQNCLRGIDQRIIGIFETWGRFYDHFKLFKGITLRGLLMHVRTYSSYTYSVRT